MTDLVFLKALRDKLKGGNSRSIHLNALPGKFATRLDLADLNVVKPHLADAFLQQLFTSAKFEFNIDFHDDPAHIRPADEQKQLNVLARRLNAICIENDDNFKEHGIRTFGFGYPILVKRTRQDPDKVIKAPLFIWPLEVLKAHNKVNSWSVLRNKTINENNKIVDEELHSVSINEVLLSFLRSDENIVLPQINDELLEDAIIDKDELLTLLLDVLKAFHATDTVSQSVLSAKLSAPVENIPDAGELEASTGTHPWIQFSGVFGLFRTQKESIISDMDRLIDQHELFGKNPAVEITEPLSPYAVVDTDPSQQEILHTLLESPYKIIQGPPGTGKSQSLTALITNALSNGMKCLVVCEKKTALDVIKSNLEKTSEELGALSVVVEDIIKDRDKIINAVRDRIQQLQANGHEVNEHPYLQSKADIDGVIKEINTQHAALYAPLFNGKNWTTLVGEFLTMKARTDITPLKEKLDHRRFKFEDDPQELNIYQQYLSEAQRLYQDINTLEHPLDVLHGRLFTGENPRLVEQELELFLNKNLQDANALSEMLKALKATYEKALQEYYATLSTHTEALQTRLSEETMLYEQALTLHYTQYYNDVKAATTKYLSFAQNGQRNFGDQFYKNSGFSKFIIKLGSIFSGKYKRMIVARDTLLTQYAAVQLVHQANDYFSHEYISVENQPSLLVLPENIQGLDSQLENWKTTIDTLKLGWVADFTPTHFHTCYTNSAALQQCWKAYVALRTRIAIDPVLQEKYGAQAPHAQALLTQLNGVLAATTEPTALLTHYLNNFSSSYLHGTFKNTKPQVVTAEEQTKAFWDMFQQSQIFLRNVIPPDPLTINTRMAAISRLWLEMDVVRQQLPNFRTYFAWRRFYEPLHELAKEVIRVMAASAYPNWSEGFSTWYYNWLLSHLENLSLPTNDAPIQRLRYLQTAMKKLQQEQIIAQWHRRQQEAVQVFTDQGLSVAGLYNKRGNKGQRRNSLRKIVASDVALFTNFFPVLMVSPSVCSSILPLEEGMFDIVIFDEASQLRLEDTFPSLMRGRIKIISGDSQQMPPTSYFQGGNALLYPAEEEEDQAPELPRTGQSLDLADSESLLMYAENSHYKPSYLKVHYRSQHPYLIDFSNHAFYGKRLIPMPAKHPYKPLRFFEVAGVYEEQMNMAEAQKVVSMLLSDIQPLPDGRFPSVGIATFNLYQRNLILEEIIKARQADPVYDQRIRDLGPGLFVKNLENIQGDERDILIISTTYGPKKDGTFRQSFGPIQQSNGYKLLNVIITRARQAVYVVSSIPETAIRQYALLLQQMKNNGRAVFYAYLAYAKAVEAGDENTRQMILAQLSENCDTSFQQSAAQLQEAAAIFTKEVVRRLQENLPPERVLLHYTVGGFRIDIAIRSATTGLPIIAIECDGSKHTQRQEAYAWDLFRQQQMEQQGLLFHRIWSANWWFDPAAALQQLLEYIRVAELPVVQAETQQA